MMDIIKIKKENSKIKKSKTNVNFKIRLNEFECFGHVHRVSKVDQFLHRYEGWRDGGEIWNMKNKDMDKVVDSDVGREMRKRWVWIWIWMDGIWVGHEVRYKQGIGIWDMGVNIRYGSGYEYEFRVEILVGIWNMEYEIWEGKMEYGIWIWVGVWVGIWVGIWDMGYRI